MKRPIKIIGTLIDAAWMIEPTRKMTLARRIVQRRDRASAIGPFTKAPTIAPSVSTATIHPWRVASSERLGNCLACKDRSQATETHGLQRGRKLTDKIVHHQNAADYALIVAEGVLISHTLQVVSQKAQEYTLELTQITHHRCLRNMRERKCMARG